MSNSAYDLVERIFEDGLACRECKYLHCWQEPVSEFWGQPVRETLCDCYVLEGRHGLKPEDCPALCDFVEQSQIQRASERIDEEGDNVGSA